jgi:hypothetical protein
VVAASGRSRREGGVRMVGVGGRGEARLSADVRSRSAVGGRRCERAGAPRPFEAAWRARKSTTSATGIVVFAALCARPGRVLLSAGRPKHTDQGTTNRHARASPLPQLHMRKGVNRNPSRRPDG